MVNHHGLRCQDPPFAALLPEAIVKNTFLELPSDEDQPPRLRTVHTARAPSDSAASPAGWCVGNTPCTPRAEAAGRLDSMGGLGGLPSNPSFETLM